MTAIAYIGTSGRRAGLLMTVAAIGIAIITGSASAQTLTGQETTQPAAEQVATPAPAPIVNQNAAPAVVSVRQAVTDAVQPQAADAGSTADAPPADAAPAQAASASGPVVKQGHRRQGYAQPSHNTYRSPPYSQHQAYGPTHRNSYHHVVRPHHFSYAYGQPSYRGTNHNSYGRQAYAPAHRSFRGYGSYSRH